jgi:class 3 adenylate cyclase/TolB-like protein/tetratricopeptide (TPR) repeat protein
MSPERKTLRAIMFTDIVGYSALTHVDEALSLELLDEHRRLVRPLIETHGREVRTIGDAFLAEFESATSAVLCALSIQKILTERNRSCGPDRKIELRIGIHLGEVVHHEEDIYGDGVNIASRLQGLCAPGEIWVSRAVYDQTHNKVACPFVPMGRQRLKNISTPISALVIPVDGSKARPRLKLRRSWLLAAAAGALIASGAIWSLRRSGVDPMERHGPPRVAVLPFSSIGLAASEDYIPDGVVTELISGLSRNTGVRVLARGSIMRFKDTRLTPAQIGQELHASVLVQGSVRKSGDRVRISVDVVDTKTQEDLASRAYEGTLGQIFDIQARITTEISRQLGGQDIPGVSRGRSPASVGPSAPSGRAYLDYLKGRYAMNLRTHESLKKALSLFQRSIAADPGFAPAYASSANVFGLFAFYGYLPPLVATPRGYEMIQQALRLDPGNAEALISLAEKQAFFDWDYPSAEKSFHQAIASKPGFATAHQWLAEFLIWQGRLSEARAEDRIALELDPLSPAAQTSAVLPDYFGGKYETAIHRFKGLIDVNPEFVLFHYWLGRVYIAAGMPELAVGSLEKSVQLSGNAPMMEAALAHALSHAGRTDAARKMVSKLLRQEKSGTFVSPYDLAVAYAGFDDRNRVFEQLTRAVESRTVEYLAVDPIFRPYAEDSRFYALLKTIRMR